jgi:hypothetical protein
MDAIRRTLLITLALVALPTATAAANTSHDGWPRIDALFVRRHP